MPVEGGVDEAGTLGRQTLPLTTMPPKCQGGSQMRYTLIPHSSQKNVLATSGFQARCVIPFTGNCPLQQKTHRRPARNESDRDKDKQRQCSIKYLVFFFRRPPPFFILYEVGKKQQMKQISRCGRKTGTAVHKSNAAAAFTQNYLHYLDYAS